MIVRESLYRYVVFRYEPPVIVTHLSKSSECPQATPEDTLISMVEAMASLDYILWSQCWKPEYKPETDTSTRENMLAAWRRVVVGKSLILKHRIETGTYILIEYELQSHDDIGKSKEPITSMATLEKTGDKWVLTNELASDPVRLFWAHPDYRQQIIAR